MGLLVGVAVGLMLFGCEVADGSGGQIVFDPSSRTDYLRDTPAGRRHHDADRGYWLIPQ